MSFGYDPYVAEQSPYHGAVYAVVESVARLVAAGADYTKIRLSFQEYFEKLTSDVAWGKPFAALLGAYAAQMGLKLPSIGGKDSMSGTFGDINVPPTLVSFAATVAPVHHIISPEFKAAGNAVALLGTPRDKYGVPDFDALGRNFALLNKLIAMGKVVSAFAVGFGGLAAAVSKMAFGNKIGVCLNYDGDFFAKQAGLFVVELASCTAELGDLEGLEVIGQLTAEPVLNINGIKIDIDECVKAWLEPLEEVFRRDLLTQ